MDPAHLHDYACQGIPDGNSVPTRVFNLQNTYLVPASPQTAWYISNGAYTNLPSGTNIDWSEVFIIQDENIRPVMIVHHGVATISGATRQVVGYSTEGNDDVNSIITTIATSKENKLRLVAKSMTVDNVGEQMYRGGYFTCSSQATTSKYNDINNTAGWAVYLSQAGSNVIAQFQGDAGVYATLQPNNKANYNLWRSYDDSESTMIDYLGGNVNVPTVGSVSSADLPGWKANIIHYVPPATWSTTTAPRWQLRISVSMVIEYQVSNATGVDGVAYDPAAIQLAFGLFEHHIPFYPASYNDFKKVVEAIRRTYNKYHPLIDVAAGYIPYGTTVKGALDQLLLDKPKPSGPMTRA